MLCSRVWLCPLPLSWSPRCGQTAPERAAAKQRREGSEDSAGRRLCLHPEHLSFLHPTAFHLPVAAWLPRFPQEGTVMTKTINLASSCSKTPSYPQAAALLVMLLSTDRYQTCIWKIRTCRDRDCFMFLVVTVATSHLPAVTNTVPFPMVLLGGDVPSSPTSYSLTSRGPELVPALPLLLSICLPVKTNKRVIMCTRSRHMCQLDPRTPNPRGQTLTRPVR